MINFNYFTIFKNTRVGLLLLRAFLSNVILNNASLPAFPLFIPVSSPSCGLAKNTRVLLATSNYYYVAKSEFVILFLALRLFFIERSLRDRLRKLKHRYWVKLKARASFITAESAFLC